VVERHLGELASERSVTCADDDAPCGDAVGRGDGVGVVERQSQLAQIEVRVERQLLRHHQRGDEQDARAAVGSEPAGEVEGVLGLGSPEQRHHDRAIADSDRAPRKAPRPPPERTDARAAHQST